MLFYNLCVFLLLGVVSLANANYDDIRCRCTCLAYPQEHLPMKIYNASVLQDQCNCDGVVLPALNETVLQLDKFIPQYCLRCECKYDVRSTKTMQVVVLIYLSLLGTLLLYMFGLLIVEIGKKMKSKAHAPLLSADSDDSMARLNTNNTVRGGSHVMQRLNSATEGWKKEVEKQRDTVFGRHDILQ